MKSLNIVFCALSFITLPLVAMELQKETKKRAAEEIEEEKPAKVQAIESEQEQEIGKALEKEHARIAQEEKIEQEWQKKSAFERLPLELKAHILTFLKTAPGNTKEARLQAAAQNIRNFMVLNKEFNTFLNDIPTNEYLINELAKNYIARNPNQISYSEGIKAALVLQTTGAGRFLLQYAYSDKNEITDFGKAIAVQLFQAADENNLPRVEFILRNIPRIITAVDLNESISNDYESFTLLQRATQQGNEPLVKIALNALKRVNEMRSALASAPDGTTLLSLAAYSGNVAIFDLIKNYVSPQHLLAYIKLPNKFGRNMLHLAAEMGHGDMIERILKIPGAIDLNSQQDFQGLTPLILAVRSNKLAAVKKLLEIPGPWINSRDRQGSTALILAVQEKNLDIIKALLETQDFGGPGSLNINLTDRDGHTALYYAQNLSDVSPDIRAEIVKMLIEHGAQ